MVYDTECSGLDTNEDVILELGWAIYSARFKNDRSEWRLIRSCDTIIDWAKRGIECVVHPEAQAVTGLSKQFVSEVGHDPLPVFEEFLGAVAECDYIGGFNSKKYDDEIISSNLARIKGLIKHDIQRFNMAMKIDFMVDIDYPNNIATRKLTYLALEHGYVIPNAHQALSDVFGTVAIAEKYDLQDIIENSQTPAVERFVRLSYGHPSIPILKLHRFYWNPEHKVWTKTIRENKVIELHNSLGFDTLEFTKENLQLTL